MVEIVGEVVVPGVDAAAGHKHEAHARGHGLFQPDLCVQIVQFFQKAAFFDSVQIGEIVRQIVLHDRTGNLHETVCKTPVCVYLRKGVGEVFQNCCLVPALHLPDRDDDSCAAVGIRQVEHMAKSILLVLAFGKKGNAFRALVDPPAKTVPSFDLRTGRSIGALGVDKDLLSERIFIIVGGGGQKVHIPSGIGTDLFCRLRRQLGNGSVFAWHGPNLLIPR